MKKEALIAVIDLDGILDSLGEAIEDLEDHSKNFHLWQAAYLEIESSIKEYAEQGSIIEFSQNTLEVLDSFLDDKDDYPALYYKVQLQLNFK